MAMVHGCTLADRSFVGLGAIVMDGCAIDSEGMLAAGAMKALGWMRGVLPFRVMMLTSG
jgi:carbonic anhydrase/acetyltransferase-like protein (isoleucine patch superfamily)